MGWNERSPAVTRAGYVPASPPRSIGTCTVHRADSLNAPAPGAGRREAQRPLQYYCKRESRHAARGPESLA